MKTIQKVRVLSGTQTEKGSMYSFLFLFYSKYFLIRDVKHRWD